LHGPDGLGGNDFPCAELHHAHASDRLIGDVVRQNPGEVSVLILGPCSALARALDRDAELARHLERVIVVGGAWHDPGDVGAASEFHFWCDPVAARKVLHCGAAVTLLPLDVTRKLVLSPADVRQLPDESRAGRFLRKVVPAALAATAGLYGIEGVYVN